jgi:hypothetical protein
VHQAVLGEGARPEVEHEERGRVRVEDDPRRPLQRLRRLHQAQVVPLLVEDLPRKARFSFQEKKNVAGLFLASYSRVFLNVESLKP